MGRTALVVEDWTGEGAHLVFTELLENERTMMIEMNRFLTKKQIKRLYSTGCPAPPRADDDRTLAAADPALRRAHWWERLLFGHGFPPPTPA
jgi:hypothetical protein